MNRWTWMAYGLASLLLAAALSGCLGSGPAGPASGPSVRSQTSGPGAGTPAPTEVPLGDRPHVHDFYWNGGDTLTLMDSQVPVILAHNHEFDEPPRPQHTHGCTEELASTSQGGSVKFSLPRDQIVPPGTDSLDFKFAWSDSTITGLQFMYRPANQHDYVHAGLPESGKTMKVQVTEKMADMGHSTRTQWAFFLCADSSSPVNVAQGTVSVGVIAHRGPVMPLEPAHPKLWRDQTNITLSKFEWSGKAISVYNKGQNNWFQMDLPHGSLIPMGTRTVSVNVGFTSVNPEAVVDPGTVMVYYRDSTVPDWIYKVAKATQDSTGHLAFQIATDDNMADGFYAEESNWDFWIRIASQTQAGGPAGTGIWGAPNVFDGTVSAVLAVSQLGDVPADA